MGQSHGVDTHLTHDACILVVVFVAQGVAHFRPLLMAVDALQSQVFAVEEEALVGVHLEIAQAQRLFHAVDFLAVFAERHLSAVDERICRAVPEMRFRDGERQRCHLLCGLPFNAHRAFRFRHHLFAVKHTNLQCRFGSLLFPIRERDGGRHVGLLLRHLVLRQIDPRRGIVERRDAKLLRRDEMYRTIDAAVEIEVANEWHDVERLGVVHTHEQGIVLSVVHTVGDFKDESPIAATVFPHHLSIDEEVGYLVGPFEAQEEAASLPVGWDEDFLCIVADAPFVVDFPDEGIRGVPGVGEVHPLSAVAFHLMREAEAPVVVHCLVFALGVERQCTAEDEGAQG